LKPLHLTLSVAVAAVALGGAVWSQAQTRPTVSIDADDIGGVVAGEKGPEAGVWVIAETTDLPTKFARIVVTDDQGRFVIPDLPSANYQVWVRGYGLVDSAKVTSAPGRLLDLKAVTAPDAAAAAKYYPAIYWYSMLKIPAKDQFGGSSDIPAKLTQVDWLKQVKNIGCVGCHALGQESTRTLPKSLGPFESHHDAWVRRIQSGQSGEQMVGQAVGQFGGVPLEYYADWTQRIEKGELPQTRPERPRGVERNIVVTSWEWGGEKTYLHDLIASDRRYPTVNGYGPLYGAPEYSTDDMPILDPKSNRVTNYRLPVRDPGMPESLGPGHAAMLKPLAPSPYWGDEKTWSQRANNHNSMFGRDGRLWLAAAVRDAPNPAFCRKGSTHPAARAFPIEKAARHVAVYDPKTGKYTFVDTCFGSHHLQFGYDKDDTLWPSGTGEVAGWINTRVLDQTGDSVRAQGWSPFVLDTNGNGRRDEFLEPDAPSDAAKDQRIRGGYPYAVMPSPVDGSIWYSVGVFGGTPALLRFVPGSDPVKTGLTEIYHVPPGSYGIRGADIDSQGVVWASMSSGHIGSFDRRKCKGPLNGPKAIGNHCPEGWSFYQYPGPGFAGLGENSAESSYYSWVDQHDTFGLGRDVPMSTANLMGGLVALKDGQMISLTVPYPMGFYAKGFDGRIDDPKAGWKGRGLWTTSGDRTPWLMEGGKGAKPRAVQFQIRPNPLAK
jgi:hypothetical protein